MNATAASPPCVSDMEYHPMSAPVEAAAIQHGVLVARTTQLRIGRLLQVMREVPGAENLKPRITSSNFDAAGNAAALPFSRHAAVRPASRSSNDRTAVRPASSAVNSRCRSSPVVPRATQGNPRPRPSMRNVPLVPAGKTGALRT